MRRIQLSARSETFDPQLGDCVVFGGSLGSLCFFGAVGLVWLYFGLSSWTDGNVLSAAPCLLIGALLWLLVIRELRLRLLVGRDGFRYVGFAGSVLASWHQVSDIALPRGRGVYLLVSLRDGGNGREVRLYGGFSARTADIRALMVARRNAATEAERGSSVG